MDKYMRTINEYYINLEYDINKKEALKKISDLSLELEFKDANNFGDRLNETALIIEDNFFLFASVCEHIDIVTSIINYLKYFSVQFMHGMKNEFDDKYEAITSLMLTICNINKEPEVQLFLEDAIIKNSEVQDTTQKNYNSLLSKQYIEIILLEEADLYAFINCLKTELKIKNVSSLNKIWVQESINQAFQWHIKKYFRHLNVTIYIFQSKKELFAFDIDIFGPKIFSIWSEDIISARNLAISYKGDVVFINTHMNFCAGILLPYANLFDALPSLDFLLEDNYINANCNKCIINPKEKDYNNVSKYYNLFYNGTWQKPQKNMYWIHNDYLLANATKEDFEKCVNSASEGYKIWSTKSINTRMYILSQLASILECKGEFSLAEIVSKWLKLPYFYTHLLTRHENEQFEITKVRTPKGIIIIEEKDKVTMFRELTQSLITGNSIIVICNADLCTLAPYCDIFSTATIPPGVINLFSSKNIKDIKYDNLAELKPDEVYVRLTKSKHIVVCLK